MELRDRSPQQNLPDHRQSIGAFTPCMPGHFGVSGCFFTPGDPLGSVGPLCASWSPAGFGVTGGAAPPTGVEVGRLKSAQLQ